MYAFEDEGEYSRSLARVSDEPQALDRRQSFLPVSEYLLLVGHCGIEVDRRQVVDRRAECDAAADVRSARLELVGRLRVVGLLKGHQADHAAPPLVGRHL